MDSAWSMLVPRGLEPRTLRLLAVRSGHLSYETFELIFYHLAFLKPHQGLKHTVLRGLHLMARKSRFL